MKRRADRQCVRLRSFAVAVLLLGVSTSDLIAQEALRLRLTSRDCSDTALLELGLENPGELEVGGFQLFIEFPADAFEVADFQSGELAGLVSVNGPPPFGAGFDECGGEDSWDDGSGRDVFAIVASVYDGEPLSTPSIALGSIVFTARAGAVFEEAVFRVAATGCAPLHAETAAFFDAAGQRLDLDPPEAGAQASPGGDQVRNLECVANSQEGGAGLLLTWDPPEDGSVQVDGYVIYRNGEQVASRAAGETSWIDEAPGVCQPGYAVAVVDSVAGELPCRARRSFVGEFIRGDVVDRNGLDTSDAVASLEHQFLGKPVDCPDAVDFDDNGVLELADPVSTLEFVFLGGGPPPPPHPDPGADPTPDELCCY